MLDPKSRMRESRTSGSVGGLGGNSQAYPTVYGQPTIRNAQGNVVPASPVGNPYLFTGREYDPETGLYFYRARTYDPATGRFLQRDPLGYVDGLGLQTYATDSPAMRRDPSGLAPEVEKWQRDRALLQTALGRLAAAWAWLDALGFASRADAEQRLEDLNTRLAAKAGEIAAAWKELEMFWNHLRRGALKGCAFRRFELTSDELRLLKGLEEALARLNSEASALHSQIETVAGALAGIDSAFANLQRLPFGPTGLAYAGDEYGTFLTGPFAPVEGVGVVISPGDKGEQYIAGLEGSGKPRSDNPNDPLSGDMSCGGDVVVYRNKGNKFGPVTKDLKYWGLDYEGGGTGVAKWLFAFKKGTVWVKQQHMDVASNDTWWSPRFEPWGEKVR